MAGGTHMKSVDENSLSYRIRELRKKANMTQLELANKLNVTDKAVSKWEASDGNPDISLLSEIAKIFNVSIDYLLTGKETEKEIVYASKIEVCARKDDPSLLKEIPDIGVTDEKGHNLLHYMIECESIKVFDAIVKGEGKGYLFGNRHSSNDYVADLLFLLLISNNIKKVNVFNFNDIGCADIRELNDKFIKALFTDERVSKETQHLVLSFHKRQILVGKEKRDGFRNGNWQSLYPFYLGKAIEYGNDELLKLILKNILEINGKAAEAIDKGERIEVYVQRGSENIYSGHEKYYVVGVKADVLRKMLTAKKYDELEELNNMNSKLKLETLTNKEIENFKIDNESNLKGDEKLVAKSVLYGVVNIKALKESTDNLELVIAAVKKYAINYYEVFYNAVKNKKYRDIMNLALDRHFDEMSRFIMAGEDKNILHSGAAHFLTADRYCQYDGEYKDLLEWQTKIPLDSGVRSNSEKAIAAVKAKRKEILEQLEEELEEQRLTIKLEKAKSKATEGLSKKYFESELEKGNYEIIVIKLCVLLEQILICNFRYQGTFEEMLNQYCQKELSWTEDDGWGYMVDRVDDRKISLLNNLRKQRNNITHGVKKETKDLSLKDIKECIEIITALNGEK